MTAPDPHDLIRQRMALIQELEIAMYSIESGLAVLQRNQAYQPKPRHFTFLLLLATGLERLMKLVICLDKVEKTGSFPAQSFLQKKLGHDLRKLRDTVAHECFSPTYRTHPAGKADYAFITDAPLLNELLLVLSDFAQSDRYIFMNGVSDPKIGREWPKIRWEGLERATMPDRYMQLLGEGKLEAIKAHANVQLVACIEQFVRALARLFTMGQLGDIARRTSPVVYGFLMLADNDLGKKRYEL